MRSTASAVFLASCLLAGLVLLLAGCGGNEEEKAAQLEAVGQFLRAFHRAEWDGLIAATHSDLQGPLQEIKQKYGDRVFPSPAGMFPGNIGLPGDIGPAPGEERSGSITDLKLTSEPETRGDSVRLEFSYVYTVGATGSQSGGMATLTKDGADWKVVSYGGMRIDAWLLDGMGW